MDTIPKKQSETFETFERIAKKISNLKTILGPVSRNVPEKVREEEVSTEVINRLHYIENQLSDLLDSIDL